MKKRSSFLTVFLAGMNGVSLLCCLIQPANAGKGFTGETPSGFLPHTDADLTVERIEASKRVHSFSWKHWSTPYSDGALICRQHQGDIACFPSETSGRLNWKTLPETSTSKSLERNHVN
jgi:hypothetical protein